MTWPRQPRRLCAHCGIERVHQPRHTYCSNVCAREAAIKRPKPGCVWRKAILLPNGCWHWTGFVRPDGYGSHLVHRDAYREFVGPIPSGMQIDHLCRNRGCCNPAHLEAVTPRENTMRSPTAATVNFAKTYCLHGHPFTPENTYIHPASSPRAGRRTCRTCLRVSWRKFDAKRPGHRGRRAA